MRRVSPAASKALFTVSATFTGASARQCSTALACAQTKILIVSPATAVAPPMDGGMVGFGVGCGVPPAAAGAEVAVSPACGWQEATAAAALRAAAISRNRLRVTFRPGMESSFWGSVPFRPNRQSHGPRFSRFAYLLSSASAARVWQQASDGSGLVERHGCRAGALHATNGHGQPTPQVESLRANQRRKPSSNPPGQWRAAWSATTKARLERERRDGRASTRQPAQGRVRRPQKMRPAQALAACGHGARRLMEHRGTLHARIALLHVGRCEPGYQQARRDAINHHTSTRGYAHVSTER